jgi:hypothetical protein
MFTSVKASQAVPLAGGTEGCPAEAAHDSLNAATLLVEQL